ncbi:hypothetical protein KOW79_012631 [Hemibagrus wyckioides]|uniref:Uncharacterized protein n=1 Tax=Hemibagrus wyckioides TaxID=337641 RepID=A0A9D3NP93_9TELE|nr:hypothetical protein KOW79_012631 [Hemibagrus wyckioides]
MAVAPFFLRGVQLCPALGRRGGGVRRQALFSSCFCPLIKLSERSGSERRGRQRKNSGGAKKLRPPRSIQSVILLQLKPASSTSLRSTNSFRCANMMGPVWTGVRGLLVVQEPSWTEAQQRSMAPDKAVTLTHRAKTSAHSLQDSGGRPSHTPVLHLSAAPAGEAPAPAPDLLTSSSSCDDFFPSPVPLRVRSTERQQKMENFENFPPRRPLKLAPLNIELPLEIKKTQRQKIHSLWKEEPERLELSAKKVSNHGKTHLLPVNQITLGQRLVRKKLDHQIHSSPDLFKTHPNMTSVQSACGLVSIDQLEGRKSDHSKLRRARRPDEDQSKSAERLKDDEGKPAASGAELCQRGMEKVLEKPSSRNPAGKMWEAAMGKGSRKMAVYDIQEAAL